MTTNSVTTVASLSNPPINTTIPSPVTVPIAPVLSFEDAMKEFTVDGQVPTTESISISCVIHPSFVEIKTLSGATKHISHSDFKKTILNLETREAVQEEVQVSGILPPSNVFFLSIASKEIRISCYYPGTIKPLLYGSRVKSFNVVAPNIIISHILTQDTGKDWVISSTRYFCTDLPISKLPRTFINSLNSSARVFLLPLSNTYDDGKMCYGSNSMKARYKDNNLRGLDYYYSYLWETPFNDDLGIRAISNMGVGTWYDLLADRAKENKPFPYAKLRGWSEGEYSNSSNV